MTLSVIPASPDAGFRAAPPGGWGWQARPGAPVPPHKLLSIVPWADSLSESSRGQALTGGPFVAEPGVGGPSSLGSDGPLGSMSFPAREGPEWGPGHGRRASPSGWPPRVRHGPPGQGRKPAERSNNTSQGPCREGPRSGGPAPTTCRRSPGTCGTGAACLWGPIRPGTPLSEEECDVQVPRHMAGSGCPEHGWPSLSP